MLLCWLPFSHIYARTVDSTRASSPGCTLCLAESAETVVANLAEIQPTHFSCVPRFYEKVLAAVASPDPAVTGAAAAADLRPAHRWLGVGGAPAAAGRSSRRCATPGCRSCRATASPKARRSSASTRMDHYKPRTVGPAMPGVEVKIAPDGEVLTRGPHVMKGYWNKPAGDRRGHPRRLALHRRPRLARRRRLPQITGRKKELLVLSNGKKVVPTYIEGLLVADECIDQAVVYGEGRNFLTALHRAALGQPPQGARRRRPWDGERRKPGHGARRGRRVPAKRVNRAAGRLSPATSR